MQRILVCFLALSLFLQPQPAAAQTGCPGAQPISAVRRLSLGALATVRGVVTASTAAFTAGQSFAVQDATAGIYVYRAAGLGRTLAAGDQVCVTGRLAEYHGLLELVPVSAAAVIPLGRAQAPQPVRVSPADFGESTEGLLVSVTGPVSGLGSRRFRVGGVPVFLRAEAGISLTGLAEGCTATVIGFSADYDGAELWPRSQADIMPGECARPACEGLTIAQLQGAGDVSPYAGRTGLACVAGCVTGVTAEGFFLQSLTPDAGARTSEGLFVYPFMGWPNGEGLRPGDRVEIRDFAVQEFYGQTEIVSPQDGSLLSIRPSGSCALPAPVELQLAAAPPADVSRLYEPYEGMRVSLSFDGAVTGPTVRYASPHPAGDPEIALADRSSPFYGRRVLWDEAESGHAMVHLSGALGVDLPDVGILDRIRAQGLTGVLAYQFGRYVLLVDDPAPIRVEDVPDPSGALDPIGPDEFALCSFNMENLFDAVDDGDGDVGDWSPRDAAEYEARLAKRARAIREDLQRCTVIGLQEVEGKRAVWETLARAVGPSYRYDYYESLDGRDITVGLLFDARRVTLVRSEQAQACTPIDYRDEEERSSAQPAPSRQPSAAPPCPEGTFPLFERQPHVADVVVRDAARGRALSLRIVVVHFKSKRGDEALNAPRRAAQAAHVAALMTAPLSVALGDFNDTPGTETLAAFAGHISLFDARVPWNDRYTYIYNGLAEPLDHFVISAALDAYFLWGGPVHINADFPDKRIPDGTSRRSSDHDPLFVRFSLQPTGVSAALAGAAAGALLGTVPYLPPASLP